MKHYTTYNKFNLCFAFLLRALFLVLLVFSLTNSHTYASSKDSILSRLEKIYRQEPAQTLDMALFLFNNDTSLNIEEKASLNMYMGIAYYFMGKADSSLYHLEKNLSLCRQINDEEKLANAYNALAIVYFHMAKYQQSLRLNKTAFNVYRRHQDTVAMVNSLKGIGNSYIRLDYYDSAAMVNIRALKLLDNSRDSMEIKIKAGLLMNLGSIMDRNNNDSLSLEYYKTASKLFMELGNIQELARTYHNIGTIHMKTRTYDTALKYLERALRLKKQENMQRHMSSTLMVIGTVYEQKGQILKQKAYYNKALETANAVNNGYDRMSAMISLADIYKQEGNTDSVAYFLGKIEQDKDLLTSASLKAAYHDIKALYLEDTGNYNEALQHLRDYVRYHDTATDIKIAETSMELEKKYQTLQKEKENQQLKNRLLQNRLAEARQKATMRYLIFGITALVVILLLSIYLLRIRTISRDTERKLRLTEKEKSDLKIKTIEKQVAADKKIRKLNEEKYQKDLELKNRKLAAMAMEMTSKNAIFAEVQSISKEIGDLRLNNKIDRLLKKNINLEKEWEQFIIHFEKVHPHFFTKLKKQFPKLTDYDLRLAAYLKIKLSSKEIAQMLNITPSAVNKSRQRLRKKLSIGSETDFTQYFDNLS